MNNADFEDAVFRWWVKLQNDSKSRAILRRESDILGIQMNPAFYDLYSDTEGINRDTLACVAMVICHMDRDSKKSLPAIMGSIDGTSDHKVSELRFRRLVESDLSEMSRMIIRVLPIVENTGNIRKLAISLRYWDSELQISKKEWMEDYYMSKKKE